jgi:hypothetical protein
VDRPTHPLQAWLERKSIDYDQAANLCRRAGRKVSPKYLEQIARGYYSPSYSLAKFLADRLTQGAVSIVALKDFPYARTAGGRAA